MTTQPQTARGAFASTHPDYWINITAEDIPPGWMDNMVKRLFDELNRQMIRVERTSIQISDKKNAKDEYDDKPDEREQHARTLASLQRSLERLTAMETSRAPLRKSKPNRKPGEIRATLEQRLAKPAEPAGSGGVSGKSE